MLTPQEQADWTHVAYRNNAAANGTAVAYTHPQYGTSAQALYLLTCTSTVLTV